MLGRGSRVMPGLWGRQQGPPWANPLMPVSVATSLTGWEADSPPVLWKPSQSGE